MAEVELAPIVQDPSAEPIPQPMNTARKSRRMAVDDCGNCGGCGSCASCGNDDGFDSVCELCESTTLKQAKDLGQRLGRTLDFALDFLSGNATDLLSKNKTALLSGNRSSTLNGERPKVLSENKTAVLSGNKAEGNTINLFSNIHLFTVKVDVHTQNRGTNCGNTSLNTGGSDKAAPVVSTSAPANAVTLPPSACPAASYPSGCESAVSNLRMLAGCLAGVPSSSVSCEPTTNSTCEPTRVPVRCVPANPGLPPTVCPSGECQMSAVPDPATEPVCSQLAGPLVGVPMTGMPIGIADPPHIPLGVPAGFQAHAMPAASCPSTSTPYNHVAVASKTDTEVCPCTQTSPPAVNLQNQVDSLRKENEQLKNRLADVSTQLHDITEQIARLQKGGTSKLPATEPPLPANSPLPASVPPLPATAPTTKAAPATKVPATAAIRAARPSGYISGSFAEPVEGP
jgi:hypothetical protein